MRAVVREWASRQDERRLQALIATVWAALGTFAFAFMWVLPKLAGAAVPPMQVGFLRFAAATLVVAPFYVHVRIKAGATGLPPQGAKLALLNVARAFFAFTGVAFGVYAVTHIPLANAQAIGMTSGVFTVILAAMFLHERVGWVEVLACALAFGGALVVAAAGGRVASLDGGSWTAGVAWAGVAAAFGQALSRGIEVVILRATAIRDSAARMLLQINIAGSAMMLAAGIWYWAEMPIETFLLVCCMGPVAIFGQICNIRAFRIADAAMLVPIRYSGIVFAAILGIVIFDEVPTLWAILGAVMIMGGAAWLALKK